MYEKPVNNCCLCWPEPDSLPATLQQICCKLRQGESLDRQDGLVLAGCDDLHSLGTLALAGKLAKSGKEVYYTITRHINYTNVCENACEVCYFYRSADDSQAFTLNVEEILTTAKAAVDEGAVELHIVGGINRQLRYDYYVDLVGRLHRRWPNVTIKAFTAVEIDHLSQISGKSIEGVLRELKDAGLSCIPGGGAEIFAENVRRRCFANKISAKRWLQIHRIAHDLSIRSTATMLFGHIESPADRVDHLLGLRDLQARTGGFLAMVPLPFHTADTDGGPGGLEVLRTFALCRLMLDNFDHVKAFYPISGLKIAEVALQFGVDDLDGTVGAYKIVSQGQSPGGIGPDRLRKIILQAGFEPVLRNSFYQAL